MQAVIQIGSTQYLVTKGQEILVDKLKSPGLTFPISQVLALIDGDLSRVGTPYLPDVTVTAQVLSEVKGDKIRIATFKAKSKYRRVKGFRAKYSKLKISDISTVKSTS